jgi:hypothetical protein
LLKPSIVTSDESEETKEMVKLFMKAVIGLSQGASTSSEMAEDLH